MEFGFYPIEYQVRNNFINVAANSDDSTYYIIGYYSRYDIVQVFKYPKGYQYIIIYDNKLRE